MMIPAEQLVEPSTLARTGDGHSALRPSVLKAFCARVARIRVIASTAGGALVEVAATLPVMLLIMTGIFTFSIALYQKLQLAEAISAGGRTLAVDRGDTDPCSTTTSAIYAAAPGLTQSGITLTFVLNGVTTNGKTCPGVGGAKNTNMVQGATASVAASYTCTIKAYGFTYPGCTIASAIKETVQ